MTRQRIPASTWRERIEHWRSSGLSAEAYAHEHDIGLERLKYWARRVERGVVRPRIVPVRVSTAIASPPLELRGPSGWSLRLDGGVDAAWLAALLQGLR